MNERLVLHSVTITDPDEGNDLNTGHKAYFTIPVSETIVYVSAAPLTNDAAAVMGVEDDETAVIESIDVSDADVPGTWISTHFGGSETPVEVVAGSDVSFGFTDAAVGNAFFVEVFCLVGEYHA